MKNVDMRMHVRGKSIFVDDIAVSQDLLHAVFYKSPVAKGRIKSIDISEAMNAPEVEAVFTSEDVPGINQIGHIVHDQPLLAYDEVEFIGQPIAMVVAKTRKAAEKAARLVKSEIEELEPVLDPRRALELGQIHAQRRVLVNGDASEAFSRCAHIAEGSSECGGQEHFYFETQRALAIPMEDGTIKVSASCQSPGKYHHHIAEVLDIPMHRVELEIRRLGGGFGGKESSAQWVVAPALAAFLLNKPVKMALSRNDDIATTGKRHPYFFDYRIGVDEDGKILAYEIDLYQHAGACVDISVAVLGRSFLHVSNSYKIPNIRVTATSCRTNIPPNNAFRGFGVPQAAFSMETAIEAIAEASGIAATEIRRKNLLVDGDSLPYGMTITKSNAVKCWEELDKQVDFQSRISAVEEYNKTHENSRKGIAVIPVCFGISFAQTALNQASALINIYVDGSVSVSTGAVEMGQGVNTKILRVVADALGIEPSLVRLDTTNTSRIPNASPTSASTGADLNGMAAKIACDELIRRLQCFVARKLNHDFPEEISFRNNQVYLRTAQIGYEWKALIKDAQWARTDLSCHAFYATPGIYHNNEKERGRPFAYYSYGTSVTEVKVDLLRGNYDIEAIDIIHDVGRSLSPEIDRGQIEGAVIQAMGWATMEQLVYGEDGRMLTGASSYKIPDINFCPEHFNIYLLENSDNPYAICNSKAVGEPPFIHGLGAYFALLNALRNIRKDKPFPGLPLTPEKVFMYLNG